VAATLLGLYGSLAWDLPTNQLIAAFLAAGLPLSAGGSHLIAARRRNRKR